MALADLNDPISGYAAPVDPVTKEPYTYAATGKLSFKLCGTFDAPTQLTSASQARYAAPMAAPVGVMGKEIQKDTWQHGAGQGCFERTIDPLAYPPFSKQITR